MSFRCSQKRVRVDFANDISQVEVAVGDSLHFLTADLAEVAFVTTSHACLFKMSEQGRPYSRCPSISDKRLGVKFDVLKTCFSLFTE